MVDDLDLANAIRDERKTAELKPLEKDFYSKAGEYIAGLEDELSSIEDHYSVEAQIVEDELKSARKSVEKLIDLRMKKIARNVLRRARSSSAEAFKGMTSEEKEIYGEMLSSITSGRKSIQASLSRTRTQTERPLTDKKDIAREYTTVRLLENVSTFMGVNGRRYRLSKDDVVKLPAVHAKNLCNKNLACEVDITRVRSRENAKTV